MAVVLVLIGIIAVVITGMTAAGFFMRANVARRNAEPDARRYVMYGLLFCIPTLLVILAASAYPGIIAMERHHH